MVSPQFEKAAIEIEQINGKLANDDLLDLYATFKIAHGQEPSKPGMFDMAGKAKSKRYTEWKEKGTTAEQAEQEYIKLVEGFKTKHGHDPTRTTKADGTAIDEKKLQRLKEL
ncbi:hypothetical protein EJ05DRAFT_504094 [Pseudovirgaria hyperparasitica]|uniref:ACB domain-containing protein n=1 Tax=Pseudovirgaria hyperparasitica TaxID=470096 RepID=A0A6A6VY33_9PEZI|nr:uncharacterized protein EJ05DRAFT_504094 [Pseudovirgaria hyperparasitica]KAF2754560.1 hypothetical protein EJ05DRAFT_504094 [Pseudovirgaria hyperparasitica]